jgi:hypothetical protein
MTTKIFIDNPPSVFITESSQGGSELLVQGGSMPLKGKKICSRALRNGLDTLEEQKTLLKGTDHIRYP